MEGDPVRADNKISELLPALRALADPTRLRVFDALLRNERCVRDLVDKQSIPQPLASHHLRVLMEAGLVRARKEDGFTMYAVDADGMGELRSALADLLDPDRLPAEARPGGNVTCCR